jgi:hypothetical protein
MGEKAHAHPTYVLHFMRQLSFHPFLIVSALVILFIVSVLFVLFIVSIVSVLAVPVLSFLVLREGEKKNIRVVRREGGERTMIVS